MVRTPHLLASSRRALRSPLVWVGVFVPLVCVAIMGIEIWRERFERDLVIQTSQAASLNLASSLAQHADDTLEIADTVLFGLRERLTHDGATPAAIARLRPFLQRRVQENPRIRNLFVYGADGSWLASSLDAMPANMNNADREYFRRHVASDDPGPFLGPPIRSRSEGQWVVTLSRRYDHPDGRFAGVVAATIDVGYFSGFYSKFDIGRQGVVLLLNGAGRILARYPHDDKLIDRDLSAIPSLDRKPLTNPYGVSRTISPFDHVERIFGYAHGRRFPVVALALKSEREILADWRANALAQMALTSLLISLIAALGFQLGAYIRRHRRAESTLTALSRTDPLTGLCNRRAFDQAVATEWSRCQRDRTPLSLIMLDIDRFKLFNDGYGHQAGDACLKQVADALRQQARRPADMVARFGGEEYAVLLPGTGAEGAALVAEAIRLEVQGLCIEHESNPPSEVVTISGGVASSESASSVVELIALADQALYRAKRAGRDRIVGGPPVIRITRSVGVAAA